MAPGSAKMVVLGLLAVVLPGPRPPTYAVPSSSSPSSRRDPVAPLVLLENQLRADTDFQGLPAWESVSGPDPIALVALPELGGAAGLLRGDDALLLVGADGATRQSLKTARRPTALARAADGALLVASAFAPRLERFAVTPTGLAADGVVPLPGVLGARVLATGEEGAIYVAEEHTQRLLVLPQNAREPQVFGECHGPAGLVRQEGWLIVLCTLDHEVRVYDVDQGGIPRPAPLVSFRHDGPIWSVAARRAGDSLWLAAGGVEDRPLDRRGGVFGYVDSFVFVYELELAGARLTRRAAINVSPLGVVTPRWLTIEGAGEAVVVDVTGEGHDRRAHLVIDPVSGKVVEEKTRAFPLGTTALVRWGQHELAASPLLDAWVVDGERVVALPGPPRDPELVLGELLVSTTLIAPGNDSSGRHSRFTCTTCHDGGYGDGRVHNAGRGDVIAATRPLRGLGNGRPYFSRALDRTMAVMVHAEFGAAARGSGHPAWFAADASVAPWLAEVPGLEAKRFTPLALRKALMSFLTHYSHAENPAAQGRAMLSIAEARGATLFKARCEDCHQARMVTDLAGTRVPFERWSELILGGPGPITWSSDGYARTGIEPYVHAEGARVPSLRRIYRKFPYFTTGVARTLPELLGLARWDGGQFRHGGASAGDKLGDDEISDLTAFLRLL